MVTALASLPGDAPGRLAVGGEQHVASGRLTATAAGSRCAVGHDGRLRAGRPPLGRRAALGGGERPGAAVDDYDWEARHGGGFAALDPADGRTRRAGPVRRRLGVGERRRRAWSLVPGALCGFGRRGELHLFDTRDGALVRDDGAARRRVARHRATAAAVGEHLVYGFNRGGYRLWAASIASVQQAVRSRPARPRRCRLSRTA